MTSGWVPLYKYIESDDGALHGFVVADVVREAAYELLQSALHLIKMSVRGCSRGEESGMDHPTKGCR